MTRRTAALLLTTAVALAGCSAGAEQTRVNTFPGGSPETGAASASASPTATSAAPSSSSSATPAASGSTSGTTAAPQGACSSLTGAQAFDKWVGQVPPDNSGSQYAWDKGMSDVKNYDPCAELSWIMLSIKTPSLSSPYQVMFFNKGEYVGTATSKSFGFQPEVKRKAANAVEVTFHFIRGSESNAEHSGEARSTYTWEAGKLTRKGALPPPTGQGEPVDDTEAGSAAPVTPGEIPPGSKKISNKAAFRVGSSKVGCEVSDNNIGCGDLAWAASEKYGSDAEGARWMVLMQKGAEGRLIGNTFYPDYMTSGAMVLNEGDAVHTDYYACEVKSGLSCWNLKSKHGLYIGRDTHRVY